ncbi:DUF4136 domain-containing protein [Telluribacter humicola]|uniref:DUF4136 domain-containing protein n=1 Tax=Telluribacter humicola TaxID=1720261 RepID=UPI0021D4065B|nr:DUF4136 domain-containing protein [Telluribacter humicola]
MKEASKFLLVILTLVTISLTFSSCARNNYTVTSDKDMSAPFDSYKTFAWAKSINSAQSLAYVVNDAILKSAIRDAVAHELAARSYTMNSQNPDVLINFRVFDKPVEMTGYEGYFRDAEYWDTDEVRNGQLGLLPRAAVNTDPGRAGQQYYFDKGTMIVQIVDAKKGVVVWQGYASGLTDGNIFDKNKDHIAKAVSLIFDKYDLVLNE